MSALPDPAPTSRLACSRLSIAVAGRTLVRELYLAFPAAGVTCILGRNGAGKTLTLHTLAGLRDPASGAVLLDEQRSAGWPRRLLARKLGLLTQTTDDPFPASVLDSVLIGRHPHIGFWQWENELDRRIARAALARVAMQDLAQRDIATLSGGERRRVALATLLAQNPDVLLLDEPINHLDPHHQIDVLELLREKASAGHTIVMSLHDAGLAARYSDHALLLFGTGEWLSGPSEQVLTAATMTRLYGIPVRELAWPDGRTFVVAGSGNPAGRGERRAAEKYE